MKKLHTWFCFACLVVTVYGCSGQTPPAKETAAADASQEAVPEPDGNTEPQLQPVNDSDIVLAAASDNSANSGKKLDGLEFDDEETLEEDEEDPANVIEPEEGSAQWIIREIAKLRIEPVPDTEDLEKLREARNERNEKIIELTTRVIELTHKTPKQERLFEVAVHYRLEARLQLALQGDRDSVDVLYDDAAWLWERNRTSKAAADAAFTLVNLSYENARRTAAKDPKWLKEFARQANHYLVSFPKDKSRSIPLVFTAARSCELHGLTEDAAKSYKLLKETFPDSEQAQRVNGILRRLSLKGESVKLGGPTLEGTHLSAADFSGKVLVVSFWSSTAKPSQDDLAHLKSVKEKFAKKGVTLVGVCLDQDQEAVTKYVADNGMDWPHVFDTEEGKRGWNNPLVNYYGLLEVGNWLIDQNGKVVSTSVKGADLEANILPLLERGARRKP